MDRDAGVLLVGERDRAVSDSAKIRSSDACAATGSVIATRTTADVLPKTSVSGMAGSSAASGNSSRATPTRPSNHGSTSADQLRSVPLAATISSSIAVSWPYSG